MNPKLIFFVIFLTISISGCKNRDHDSSDAISITISPEAGTNYKSGEPIPVKITLNSALKIDSIQYLLDSTIKGSAKNVDPFVVNTNNLTLGIKTITAKIYYEGKNQGVSTNIVLLASKAPEELSYHVEKIFPHDTSSYTEGLEYQDGYLYESSGGYFDPPPGMEKDRQSDLRKTDLISGKVLKKTLVNPKVFAEGISIVNDKIIQLTWREKIGYIYDKKTFKLLNIFNNNVGIEGWGMCFDGTKLYMDDSSNRIWFLNKNTYQQIGFIDVYDNQHAINSLNELEFIGGKIYANVYQSNLILVINPRTGEVLKRIDMSNLYPLKDKPINFDSLNYVLNGIAWDRKQNRIFVTGKKWPHVYQVQFRIK